MNRMALISGPLGALALGGLLIMGPATGQAQGQDQQGGYTARVVVPIDDGSVTDSDQFNENQPYPWPDFLGVEPLPGRYRMKVTLVDIDLPAISELEGMGEFDLEAVMRSAFPQTEYFCIAPGYRPERNWLGELDCQDCDEPQVDVDGNRFSFATQCRSDDGAFNNIRVSGTAEASSSLMLIDVAASEESFGEMTMQIRTSTQRIGECD